MTKIRVGTRASLLARTQTGTVLAALVAVAPELQFEEVLIQTEGDRTTTPLSQAKTPGVFVSALREKLLAGEVDMLVHSMKDLPALPFPGIVSAAIPKRENPLDVLVSRDNLPLRLLPSGAKIGTSSPRRTASILRSRPDLQVTDIRGNVDTRVAKVRAGEYDATVMAWAGLARIGRLSEIAEELSPVMFIPAPGQGALAVEIRSESAELLGLISTIDDEVTRLTTTAERSVLVGLGASCSTAIGALATLEGEQLLLTAELGDPATGAYESVSERVKINPKQIQLAEQLGLSVADKLLSGDVARKVGLI